MKAGALSLSKPGIELAPPSYRGERPAAQYPPILVVQLMSLVLYVLHSRVGADGGTHFRSQVLPCGGGVVPSPQWGGASLTPTPELKALGRPFKV